MRFPFFLLNLFRIDSHTHTYALINRNRITIRITSIAAHRVLGHWMLSYEAATSKCRLGLQCTIAYNNFAIATFYGLILSIDALNQSQKTPCWIVRLPRSRTLQWCCCLVLKHTDTSRDTNAYTRKKYRNKLLHDSTWCACIRAH